MPTRARLDGLERIDHVIASTDGQRAFAVQGSTHDPAHRRSQVELEQVARTPARQNALQLRASDVQQQEQAQERQQRAALASSESPLSVPAGKRTLESGNTPRGERG